MTVNPRTLPTILFAVLMTAVFGKQILGGERNREEPRRTHFTLTKKGALIPRPKGMPKPGPYYTCLVNMAEVRRFPYEYALYFSTDHANGKGGIWLYLCNGNPTEAGNWKSYDKAVADGDFDYIKKKPKANPIFVDKVQGRQTETPYANVIRGTVYMTYHNAGTRSGQSTLLATSEDGVNFDRINGDKDSIVVEQGRRHTGYLRWGPNPFSGVKHKYVGYSLYGGGRGSPLAMWGSNDALKWDRLAIFRPIYGHAIDKGKIIKWLNMDPNSIRDLGNGEYVAICGGGTRGSGNSTRLCELYEIFLADDGKTLTRKSRKILAKGPPGADDEEEVSTPTSAVLDGTWHVIYVGTKNRAGVNTVMGASGTFNKSAARSQTLKPSERKSHFESK
jgi:hypothetical protein